MRVFGSRALCLALLAGSAAANGPMDRLMQTTGTVSALAALPVDAELAYMNKALSGSLSGWDLLSDVVSGSGFGELVKQPAFLKQLVTSDSLKLMTVYPSFNKLVEDVNAGTATDAAVSKLFQESFKEMLASSKEILEVVKDPSKVADAVSKVALSEDPDVADAYYDAQEGDSDAFDIVAKAVSGDLHPGVSLDKLKEIGGSANMDKVLGMDEVMHIVDQDEHTSNVLRSITVDGMKELGIKAAEEAGADFF